MLLESAITFHRSALAAENKAPDTMRNYAMVERVFCEYLADALGRPGAVGDLTVSNVRRFLEWLRTDRVTMRPGGTEVRPGQATVRYYAVVLKIWSGFLSRELEAYFPKGDPLVNLRAPKAPTKAVEAFTVQEVQRLLDLAATTPEPLRDQAIVLLLYETGVRVSELCGLELAEIQLAADGGRAKVLGKGSRERYVYFGTEASLAVQRYLHAERGECDSPRLLLARGGVPLSRQGVEKLVARLADRAGIVGKRCSPHVFRHTFAISQVRAGTGLLQLRALLGHAKLDLIQHYARIAEADVEQSYHSLVDGRLAVRQSKAPKAETPRVRGPIRRLA